MRSIGGFQMNIFFIIILNDSRRITNVSRVKTNDAIQKYKQL